jgi:hypothetical protein
MKIKINPKKIEGLATFFRVKFLPLFKRGFIRILAQTGNNLSP